MVTVSDGVGSAPPVDEVESDASVSVAAAVESDTSVAQAVAVDSGAAVSVAVPAEAAPVLSDGVSVAVASEDAAVEVASSVLVDTSKETVTPSTEVEEPNSERIAERLADSDSGTSVTDEEAEAPSLVAVGAVYVESVLESTASVDDKVKSPADDEDIVETVIDTADEDKMESMLMPAALDVVAELAPLEAEGTG